MKYTELVKRFLAHLFLPQESNNHRALILQPSFLMLFVAAYLLNQSLIKSLTIVHPGVLGYSSEITAAKVFAQTNLERQKQNLPLLKYNSLLSRSAAMKAEDMFASDYWSHNSPDGKTPWDFFREVGYDYSVAGENLAKDFYDTDTLMKAWMKSPTHKANIIHDKYTEIGIGVVDGVLNGVKTTLVVQHFGKPLVSPGAPEYSLEELKMNTIDISEVAGAKTAAKPKSSLISPLAISKGVGIFMFVLIITVLIVDTYVTVKNKHHRLTGSTTGHIVFLVLVMFIMLLSRQGIIY